jgi:hypothetical protein
LADNEEIFVVDMNTNAVVAYGGGSKMSTQMQAVEALKALEQVDRSVSSEAQVQERVARRTESVIVTISPEARALRAADAQPGAEAPTAAVQVVQRETASIAQTAEPAMVAPEAVADVQVEPANSVPVAAPVVQAEPDVLDQVTTTPVASAVDSPQIETADAVVSTTAPETTEIITSEESIVPDAEQVARPEQSDAVDDGEELAQRAAADAATAAESTDGDASDVQPM